MKHRVRAILAVVALVGLLLGAVVAPALADSPTIVKFKGEVASRPAVGAEGTWVIDGKDVEQVENTIVAEDDADPIAVGDEVSVVAKELGDGTLEAIIIRPVNDGPARLHITGYVNDYVADDYLVVNGLRIEIDQDTVIDETDGVLEQGALVAVQAVKDGDDWIATDIKVVDPEKTIVEIVGVLEALDEDSAIIDGQEVVIDDVTWIGPNVEVGETVRARVCEESDGTLRALLIVLDGDADWMPVLTIVEGLIEEIEDKFFGMQIWTVDGQDVLVGPTTVLYGTPAVGNTARIVAIDIGGHTPTGFFGADLLPLEARVEGDGEPDPGTTLHLTGLISEVGDDYIVVNETTIAYDGDTLIKGKLEEDRLALVVAEWDGAGWLATKIHTTKWGN
jgi:hypothetical protein